MKIKQFSSILILILSLFFSSCSYDSDYSVGKDTVKSFGNNSFQIIRGMSTTNKDDCVYCLYDLKNDSTVIEDIYGYSQKGSVVYIKGYNFNQDMYDMYEIQYAVLNTSDNSIIVEDNFESLSQENKTNFSEIERYISFADNNHYAKRLNGSEKDFPASRYTTELFCNGKYQILFSEIGKKYPCYLVDIENNNILINSLYGYCENNQNLYLWGYAKDNGLTKKYIIIHNNSNIDILEEKDLSDREKEIFNSIKKYEISSGN